MAPTRGRFGEFVIEARIGIEGYVERDRARTDDGRCILSRVRRSAPEPVKAHLLAEAERASELADLHVVPLIACGRREGVVYFAHREVEGADLRELFNEAYRRQRSIPLWFSVQAVADAARGAAHAAARTGVPHAEVSPRYVHVGRDGVGRITDFGLASALHEVLGGAAATGRFSYCAPEQVEGRASDPRTDVFGFGVILFEMTTGTRCFKRRTPEETRQAVLTTAIRSPRALLAGYPTELEEILFRALSRRPDDRYATPGDLADALESFLVREGLKVDSERLGDFVDGLRTRGSSDAVAPVDVNGPGAGAPAPADQPETDLRPDPGALDPGPGSDRRRDRRVSDRPALTIVERAPEAPDEAPWAAPPPPPRASARPRNPHAPQFVAPDEEAFVPVGSPSRKKALPIPELAEPEPRLRPESSRPPDAPNDRRSGPPLADAEEAPPSNEAETSPVARIPISTDNEAAEPRLAATERVRRRRRAAEPATSRDRRRRWVLGLTLLVVLGGGAALTGAGVLGVDAGPPGVASRPPSSEPDDLSPAGPADDERAGPTSGDERAEESDAPMALDREADLAGRRNPSAVDGPAGRLKLVVRPWGRVRIDGWDYGLTPVPVLRLAPGAHRVEIDNEDLGLSWSGRVEVKVDAQENLHIDLTAE